MAARLPQSNSFFRAMPSKYFQMKPQKSKKFHIILWKFFKNEVDFVDFLAFLGKMK